MPTLQDVSTVVLDVHFLGRHSPACVVKHFSREEWCRVRPENRRQYLRDRIEEFFEEMISFIEPETTNERSYEAPHGPTATEADIRTYNEAYREAYFNDPIWSTYPDRFPEPQVQRVGVDRERGRGEDIAVCQERNGEDNARVYGAEPSIHRS